MGFFYGFFNSENGDRRYTAANIGDYLQGLVTSGVYADNGTSLQVVASSGMTVTVKPGRAMLNFKYMNLDSPLDLTLAAGGAQDRVDAIVAYMDLTERACGIIVKQGTPAASPKAPAMERTSARNEYMLAKVYVTKLSTAITQSAITDTRADTNVCGWVTGLIKQVDTSTLFLQWQTAYEEAYAELGDYLEAQRAAWETFFASVTEDNVLPAPALDDVGKFPAVNDTADGYELVDLVDTIKPFANTRAAVNLLDNSDFTNPVNQRGGDNYSGVAQHTIDRWRATSKIDVTVDQETKTVDVQCSSSATTRNGFSQRIPMARAPKPGTKVTAAFMNHNGVVSVFSGTAPEYGTSLPLGDDDKTSTGVNLSYENNTYAALTIFVPPGAGLFLKWAALYEGEYTAKTLPPYRPKGYGAELLECRRYYQRINPGYIPFGFGWSNNTTPAAIRVTLPCSPMRIQPTVTFSGTLSNVRLQFNQGAVNVTSVDSVHYRPEAEYMAIFMKPNAVYVGPFVAYCISDYEIFELSADL